MGFSNQQHSRPSTPSGPERYPSQSPASSPAAERTRSSRGLSKYQSYSNQLDTPFEFPSAPSSPKSPQHMPPREIALRNVSSSSNLSALGSLAHLGLVKHERNALRSELNVQHSAIESQKELISALRKLALRLAVHISVKDARIESHEHEIGHLRQSEDVRSRELAATLEDVEYSITLHEHLTSELFNLASEPDPTSSSNQVLHQFRSCPALPFTPLSPPLSPANEGTSSPPRFISEIRQRTDSATHQHLLKAQHDAQEAVQICRSRYDTLKREIENARSHAIRLQNSTTSLQQTVSYQNGKLRDLESSKAGLSQQLFTLQTKTDDLIELATLKQLHTTELEEKLTRSNAVIQELHEAIARYKESSRIDLIKHEQLEQHQASLDESLRQEIEKYQGLEIELSESRILQSELESKYKKSQEANKKLEQEILSLQHSKSSIEEDALRFQSQLQTKLNEEENLHQEIETLQQAKHELDQDFFKIQAKLEDARKLEAVIRAEKQELEASSDVLLKTHNQTLLTLGLLQSAEAKLRSENHAVKEENLSLESQLSATYCDLSAAKASVEAFRQELVVSRSMEVKYHDELSIATLKLNESTESNDKLAKQVKSLEGTISCLENEVHSIGITLEDTVQSKKAVQEQLQTSTATSSQLEHMLREQLAELSTEKDSLESDLENLRAELGEVHLSEKNLRAQLELAQVERRTLEGHFIDELRASSEAKALLDKDLAATKTRLSSAEASTKALQVQLDATLLGKESAEMDLVVQLQASNKTIELMKTDLAKMGDNLSKAGASEAALQSQLKTLEYQNATMEIDFQAQASSLRDTIQSLEEKSHHTSTKLARAEKELVTLETKLNTEESANSIAQEELRGQITALEDSRTALRNEVTLIKSEISLKEDLERSFLLKIEKHERTSAIAVQKLRNQLQTSESMKAALEDELTTTLKLLDITRNSNKKLEAQLGEIIAAKFETEQTLYDLQRSTAEMQKRFASVSQKVSDTEGTTSNLQELERCLAAEEQLRLLAEEAHLSKVAAAEKKVSELESSQAILQQQIHDQKVEYEKLLQIVESERQRQFVLPPSSIGQVYASSEDGDVPASLGDIFQERTPVGKSFRKSRNTDQMSIDSFSNFETFRPWSSQMSHSRSMSAGAGTRSISESEFQNRLKEQLRRPFSSGDAAPMRAERPVTRRRNTLHKKQPESPRRTQSRATSAGAINNTTSRAGTFSSHSGSYFQHRLDSLRRPFSSGDAMPKGAERPPTRGHNTLHKKPPTLKKKKSSLRISASAGARRISHIFDVFKR
ncbi:hypothetical protein BP6252_12531 [Coleophoma cylindrospora]|uniref:Uncharacterized protein n=1 Tax=Coleophoma cylindrospora TaxID=1849047 RepID=A0A3D8QDD4_9HELO|nr:hypothetical protein BP6252_12531 [Coleophoma cylindrospora]